MQIISQVAPAYWNTVNDGEFVLCVVISVLLIDWVFD